jgi:hypothetical protein
MFKSIESWSKWIAMDRPKLPRADDNALDHGVLSVSALFDGMTIALFDGSRSGSGTRLRRSGMGIGYQRAMT